MQCDEHGRYSGEECEKICEEGTAKLWHQSLSHRYDLVLPLLLDAAKGRAGVVHASGPPEPTPRASVYLQSSPAVEQLYPPLFERIKEKVLAGKFHPIGGPWFENDANTSSGEVLSRQFIFGQRFFESRSGKRCNTAWLPDLFGLTGALPQLIRLAGMDYFFTQIYLGEHSCVFRATDSYVLFDRNMYAVEIVETTLMLKRPMFSNVFPHSTFQWVGINGTQALCHMAPVDTDTAQATVGDVNKGLSNHKIRS